MINQVALIYKNLQSDLQWKGFGITILGKKDSCMMVRWRYDLMIMIMMIHFNVRGATERAQPTYNAVGFHVPD